MLKNSRGNRRLDSCLLDAVLPSLYAVLNAVTKVGACERVAAAGPRRGGGAGGCAGGRGVLAIGVATRDRVCAAGPSCFGGAGVVRTLGTAAVGGRCIAVGGILGVGADVGECTHGVGADVGECTLGDATAGTPSGGDVGGPNSLLSLCTVSLRCWSSILIEVSSAIDKVL